MSKPNPKNRTPNKTLENLIRWKQRFSNFEKAILLLERTLQIEKPTEAERGGLIQFYEMAFELAWKLMKDYLNEEGFIVKSPRQAIKQSLQIDLIEDGHVWIDALDGRNLTAHTYDEETAIAIETEIRNSYFPALYELYVDMRSQI
jgi:nucleotidyltransferase substrate binding protein (TIGR01987 family)